MMDLLSKLSEKWAKAAAVERERTRDINERLKRGETVHVTAQAFPTVEGFVGFPDWREMCSHELDAVHAKLQPVIEKLVGAGQLMRDSNVGIGVEEWDAALTEWRVVNGE